eukprot:scaffold32130_cov66-Phaeocystis_antarctica.AAC.2
MPYLGRSVPPSCRWLAVQSRAVTRARLGAILVELGVARVVTLGSRLRLDAHALRSLHLILDMGGPTQGAPGGSRDKGSAGL